MKIKVFLFTFFFICLLSEAQDFPSESIQKLIKDHPRLLLTKERLSDLKAMAQSDTVLNRYVNDVLFRADNLVGTRSVEYKLSGSRLLSVSRDVKERVLNLGLAYRWTENKKYAEELMHVMSVVCDFPNWNPSHFLDVAEMTFAVALAYDWLYHYMSSDTRQILVECILKHGLLPGIKAYEDGNVDYGWWKKVAHNWNLVCNGALLTGALAVFESYPDTATKIIKHAATNLPLALNEYGPDGGWKEGPGYWSYATRYTAYALGSLQTALTQLNFGLTEIDGLSETGYFPIYLAGPTGYYLNFADSRFKKTREPVGSMFWLAKTYNNFDFSNNEHIVLQQYNASPEHVIWYVPPTTTSTDLPLNRFFEGKVQVLTLRSGWDDEDTFIGVKAGYNQVNHGHLDLGNFELDALGERWAIDLGSDDNNLPGYFDGEPGGKRWSFYRLGSKSHNVLTVNDRNQNELAESHFLEYNLNVNEPYGIIDLTETYPEMAESIHRGVKLMEGGNFILIQDEINLNDTTGITWGMTTEARITIEGQTALLEKNNKRVKAMIIAPSHAVFNAESAMQQPPQNQNQGINRLIIYLPEVQEEKIVVAFIPQSEESTKSNTYISVQPLSEW